MFEVAEGVMVPSSSSASFTDNERVKDVCKSLRRGPPAESGGSNASLSLTGVDRWVGGVLSDLWLGGGIGGIS